MWADNTATMTDLYIIALFEVIVCSYPCTPLSLPAYDTQEKVYPHNLTNTGQKEYPALFSLLIS
jgi:hypothetical protein